MVEGKTHSPGRGETNETVFNFLIEPALNIDTNFNTHM